MLDRHLLWQLRRSAIVLGLALTLSACGINTIPTREEQAKAAWSEVQNQYQRRAELIPNLVETVRGFAQQEREVLTEVTNARARATQVQINAEQLTDPAALQRFQEAQSQLSGALARLLAVSERYPDLKSNQNFLALQSQLEGTENRIAVERQRYNVSAQGFNTAIRRFPASLVASMSGFKPRAYFKGVAGSEKAPEVDFNFGTATAATQ